MQEKKLIRTQIKQKLKTLTKEEKQKNSILACNFFLESDVFKKSDYVLCYMAMQTEISCLSILKNSFESNKIIAIPKCSQQGNDLSFYKITYSNIEQKFNSQFDLGAWGLQEPNVNKCPLLQEKKLANKCITIIVPGVAFCANGARLGHGKGYYDTYLSSLLFKAKQNNFSVNIVGMCFSLQIIPTVPLEKHDIPMDYILTEKSFFKCTSSKN